MIPEPGIYQSVPAEVYHSWEAASQSQLSTLFHQTPAHLFLPKRETDAMILGTAFHCSVLEPGRFFAEYGQLPEGNRQKSGWTAQANAVRESRPEVVHWLTADQYRTVLGMRLAVFADPIASCILEKTQDRELSLVWRCKWSGVPCKSRLDGITVDPVDLVVFDLKGTHDASPAGFDRLMEYNFLQPAHYLDGMAANSTPTEIFTFILVETAAPHAVGVYSVDEEDLVLCHACLIKLRKEWQNAMTAKRRRDTVQTSYGDGINTRRLPHWLRRRIEERILPL